MFVLNETKHKILDPLSRKNKLIGAQTISPTKNDDQQQMITIIVPPSPAKNSQKPSSSTLTLLSEDANNIANNFLAAQLVNETGSGNSRGSTPNSSNLPGGGGIIARSPIERSQDLSHPSHQASGRHKSSFAVKAMDENEVSNAADDHEQRQQEPQQDDVVKHSSSFIARLFSSLFFSVSQRSLVFSSSIELWTTVSILMKTASSV
jgi:hypothetical protein